MKYILLFLLFINTADASKIYTREELKDVCESYYNTFFSNVTGALSMGMSVEDVKKNLNGTSEQMKLVNGVIDAIVSKNDELLNIQFNKLIYTCIEDNYKKLGAVKI